jgi:hypothetical protein
MSSIAKALNNIAQSLQAIATAILNSKKIDVRPAITSNPSSNVIISKVQKYPNDYTSNNFKPKFENYLPSKIVHISQEEKNAIDSIYKALTEKASYPEHYDYVMRELKNKFPDLYKSLDSLVVSYARNTKITSYPNYVPPKSVWKYQ